MREIIEVGAVVVWAGIMIAACCYSIWGRGYTAGYRDGANRVGRAWQQSIRHQTRATERRQERWRVGRWN